MEGNINAPDLRPNEYRKKTFENKTVMFIRNSQYENMPSKCGGNEMKLYNYSKKEIKSFDWLKFSIGYIVIPSSNDLSEDENEYINIIQTKNKNIYRMEESSIPTYIIYPNLPMPSQLTQQQQQQTQQTQLNNNNEDISYTLPDTQINRNELEKQSSFIELNENKPKPLSKLKKISDNNNNNKRKREENEEIEIDNNNNNEPEKKRMRMNKLEEIYGNNNNNNNNNSRDFDEDNNNNDDEEIDNINTSTRLSILQMDDDDNNNNDNSGNSGKSSKSKRRVDPFSLPLNNNNNKRRKTKNNYDDFNQQSNNNSSVNETRKKAIKITNNNSEESESIELSLPSDRINEIHKNRKIIVNESDKEISEDGNVNVIIMPMINMNIKPPGKQFVKKQKNNSVSKTKLSAYTLND